MYETVFDIETYRHPLVDIGGVEIVIALLVLVLLLGMRKRYPAEFSRGRLLALAAGMAAMIFAGELGFGYTCRSSFDSVRASFRRGECLSVEGPVRDVALQYGRMKRQSFTVGGISFSISDNYITGGYNRTIHKGGPLHEGTPVRIVYCDIYGERVIAKLAVRR